MAKRRKAEKARTSGPPAASEPSGTADGARSGRQRIAYTGVCAAVGAVLGWLPIWIHGPIPEKFDVHGIDGGMAVWAFYTARLLIGVWVGLTHWPAAWFVRGPLCGFLGLLPVTFFSLAVPECGPG